MQTFVPDTSFRKIALCLDNRRLGKQRIEAFQILCALADSDALMLRAELKGMPPEWAVWMPKYKGWINHPATRMWRGYRWALRSYYNEMVAEYSYRFNGVHTLRPLPIPRNIEEKWYEMPPWWGDEAVHSSHRAALLAKDPAWYGGMGWDETPRIQYVWPDALNWRKTTEISIFRTFGYF